MQKILATFALLLLPVLPVLSDSSLSEFIILTNPPQSEDSEEMAKTLAQNDFNTVIWEVDKLEICRKYGLKLMAHGATPEIASSLKNDPALWGYHLVDEPRGDKFHELATITNDFNQADPNHPALVNMLSITGAFLQNYLDVVQPEILSYDFYQWWFGRGEYYARLEDFRTAALSRHIPLICWQEVNSNYKVEYLPRDNTSPPPDNLNKLRHSLYSSLAYGVKGILWFSGRIMFEDEQSIRDVAILNAELKKLGPILMNLNSVNVFHTPPLPLNTRAVPIKHWVHVQGERSCDGVVVGMFKNNEGVDYIMFVNRDYRHEQQIEVEFKQHVDKIDAFDKKSGRWLENTVRAHNTIIPQIWSLPPGDGLLIRVERNWLSTPERGASPDPEIYIGPDGIN